MRIATAAHAAVPSHSAIPAPPLTAEEGLSHSGAQFASQLSAATLQSADADAWRPAAGSAANVIAMQPVLTLPKISLRPMAMSLPARLSPKSPSPKAAKDASKLADSTLAPGALVPEPAPAPLLIATAAAASDDGLAIEAQSAPAEPAVPPPPAPEESPDAIAPSVTAAGEPSHQNQDMAFATRVQPVQSTGHAEMPAEMASTAAVSSATKKVVAATEEESTTPVDARVSLSPASPTVERTEAPAPASVPSHIAPSHRTEAPAPAESAPKFTAPLKDISLQVNQPGKERIDVRVVQQGNEVHVSVHSGDASLNSGLRQGLSDLQSRLEENGYRSEMWRPGVATAPVAASPSAQSSSNFSRGDDSNAQQQQSGGSQQEGGRRHQNQSQQPHWVEEMESSLQGGQQSSGGFYGFGS